MPGPPAGPPPFAGTEYGRLAGEWATVLAGRTGAPAGTVAVFRGIPFAAPPAGPARWRPPAPPQPWSGVRPATEFGPAPVQPQPRRDSLMYQANFADRRALVMSEDCLYLNVWTPDPAPGARLGVLVWLHGGGNRFGYGHQDIHDGRNLARRGLVVVTLNYRLGALGFLAHPELRRESPDGAAGNWALLDVLAALRWVQANIAAFGGDPAQVTLAGNSAGAALACHLMAAPAARGLFARVIGQSSAGLCRPDGPLPSLAESAAAGESFARSAGAGDLAALRALSAVQLSAGGHFGPVLDGALLVAETGEVFARGEQAPVPLLVGSNADEGSPYTSAGAAAELTELAARQPAGFRAAYPCGSPAEQRVSARLFTGESRFVWPVWRWALAHRRSSGAPVWVYRFAARPPLPPPGDCELAAPPDGLPGYGAFHTAELLYAWDNLDQRAWPWTSADHALAAAMSAAWTRFAATGDPNGGGTPTWPALSAEVDPQVLHLANGDAAAWAGAMDRLTAMHALDDLHDLAHSSP
jgi:para-nitrobenzyl esterase